MANLAFRLVLIIGSFYVACMNYFNVIVGNFGTMINGSLLITGTLSIVQILILLTLYHLSRRLRYVSYGSELLLLISTVVSMVIFHYLMGVLVLNIIIWLATVFLIYCARDVKGGQNV